MAQVHTSKQWSLSDAFLSDKGDYYYYYYYYYYYSLRDLVMRVLGYRSQVQGSIPSTKRFCQK
jgi:hypothetical protein